MSKHEVRQSIKSQVLMVFFLPVILAGIHVAAAFNIIKQLMAMLNLSNTKLFMTGTAVTMLVFVIVYAIVYEQKSTLITLLSNTITCHYLPDSSRRNV